MTQKQANLLLITVSMAWGTSYLFMKVAADDGMPSFTIVAMRSIIAFIFMWLLFAKRMVRVSWQTIKYSAIVGALLYVVFLGLFLGTKYTDASTAGFLTSTTVVLVPILQIFLTKRLPAKQIMIGVVVVMMGLAFLTLKDGFSIQLGAIYCLIGALCYAIHILVTNHFARKVDVLQLGIYQLGFCSLYAIIIAFTFETPALPTTSGSWISILGLAFICSAYGFVMQPIAQKYTTPENTGFFFSLEPIFSAFFAFLFLQEVMGMTGYIGAVFIMLGVTIANYQKKVKEPRVAYRKIALKEKIVK